MTITVTYKFDNAVILITGAGSGIGAALALHCARQGAAVVAVDRRHDLLRSKIEPGFRDRIDIRELDVSKSADVAATLDAVMRKYSRLDAAVLGAAIQVRTDIDKMSVAQWREVFDVNLNGVFYYLQGIIPQLKAQRRGAIVAFTSGLGVTRRPRGSPHAASKGALIGMIKR